MSDATVCLIILVAVVALFVWNRLPVEIVAVGSALALWAAGVLPFAQVFAGFGDPVIPFVAGLFVVSEGLNASGVTAWLGRQLVLRAGESRRRLLAATMLLAAALAALISVNGATAALLPMVVLLAVRLGRSPAGLAMPVAFAGHAGSLLLLTATPINLLVSEGAVTAGGRAFGFAEYALVGVPLVVGTIALTTGLGDRLLPARTPRSLPPDLGGHARTLIRHYDLTAQAAGLRVGPHSDVSTLDEPGLVVFGAVTADRRPRGDAPPQPGDVLVVRGPEGVVHAYADRRGLAHVPRDVSDKLATILLNNELGVAEVVLGPRSALVGDTVSPGMTTDSGELVVLAVHRNGDQLGPGAVALVPGDMLLVQGSWLALDRVTGDRDVLLVDEPSAVRRQALPLGPGARPALVILAAMIVLLATGLFPPAAVAVLAAGAMIVSRVLTMGQAYEGISWTTIMIVAGLIPLSVAMRQSGLADDLAHLVVRLFGASGILLLLGMFLLTAIFGQVISNTATALIVIPIGAAAATEAAISVQPVMMCIAVAAAGAFLTPIATAANLMVKDPGGYRFGDYWKLGLVLLSWFLLIGVIVVPFIWPL